MRRTRIARKKPQDSEEAEAFRIAVFCGSSHCERCGGAPTEAHHMCLRSRCRGHKWKHSAERNGAALCSPCHAEIHDNTPSDRDQWIKPVRWLDLGGRLTTNTERD